MKSCTWDGIALYITADWELTDLGKGPESSGGQESAMCPCSDEGQTSLPWVKARDYSPVLRR